MARLELVTASPEETRSVGRAIAEVLQPGDVVALTGDLGAGKTTLVQGAASGLGVTDHVMSPTFVLVREYGSTTPVVHVDVYRLNTLQEVMDIGFDEFLDGRRVVFIEWGDVIDALLPDTHLQVELTSSDGDERRVAVTGRGRGWAERWERLEHALGTWRAA